MAGTKVKPIFLFQPKKTQKCHFRLIIFGGQNFSAYLVVICNWNQYRSQFICKFFQLITNDPVAHVVPHCFEKVKLILIENLPRYNYEQCLLSKVLLSSTSKSQSAELSLFSMKQRFVLQYWFCLDLSGASKRLLYPFDLTALLHPEHCLLFFSLSIFAHKSIVSTCAGYNGPDTHVNSWPENPLGKMTCSAVWSAKLKLL